MPPESELIDVAKTFPALHIDLKYATADNITGRPIYQEALCLLHTDAATALAKAISIAALAGLKLVSTTLIARRKRRLSCGMPARTRNTWLMWRLVPTTAAGRPSTLR